MDGATKQGYRLVNLWTDTPRGRVHLETWWLEWRIEHAREALPFVDSSVKAVGLEQMASVVTDRPSTLRRARHWLLGGVVIKKSKVHLNLCVWGVGTSLAVRVK